MSIVVFLAPQASASKKKQHMWALCPSFLQLYGSHYVAVSFRSGISLNLQLDSPPNLYFSDVVFEAQKV